MSYPHSLALSYFLFYNHAGSLIFAQDLKKRALIALFGF